MPYSLVSLTRLINNAKKKRITIRHDKTVSCNLHRTRLVIVPPHLRLHTDGRTEVVGQTIGGIGKVDLKVPRVDGQVVERVELTTKEVVEQNCFSSVSVALLLG